MLRDKEILLRSLSDADQSKLAALANNKAIGDNLRDIFPYPYTESDAQFFIELTKNELPRMNFCIEYNGEFCGMIGLRRLTDVNRNGAELGYWLGEPFWGKGIATRAVQLITCYGLKELDLIRIQSVVFEFNLASMRVLEKNGFTKDGIFKKAVIKNNRIWDEHRYSIIT